MDKSFFRLWRPVNLKVILTLIFLSTASFLIVDPLSNSVNASTSPPEGTKIVLVRFKGASPVDLSQTDSAVERDRASIAETADSLSKSLEQKAGYKKLIYQFKNFPLASYEVDSAGEAMLRNHPRVENVIEDREPQPTAIIDDPITAMGGSPTLGFTDGANYYNGAGQAIVVFDDGIDKSHPALRDKVIDEICIGITTPVDYGGILYSSACPDNGNVIGQVDEFTIYRGDGVASNCLDLADFNGCRHGTSVAAAAVMSTQNLDLNPYTLTTSGSATGAKIIAVQINHKFTNYDGVKSMRVWFSNQLMAFDLLLTLQDDFELPIASINYSYSSDPQAPSHEACASYDYQYGNYYDFFASFRSVNIAPVVSNGNNGAIMPGTVGYPACVEGAIAVGATDTTGMSLAYYSQNAPITSLLAPGGDMSFAEGGLWLPQYNTTTLREMQGTSYATPIVAGAFAVLRQKNPLASVDTLLELLQSTGKPIIDTRDGYAAVGAKPLIQLNAALSQLQSLSSDNYLSSISVINDNTNYLSGFSANTTSYDIYVPLGIESVDITAAAVSPTTIISSGLGRYDLSAATPTTARIVVVAEDGSSKTYTITITRTAFYSDPGPSSGPSPNSPFMPNATGQIGAPSTGSAPNNSRPFMASLSEHRNTIALITVVSMGALLLVAKHLIRKADRP